MGEKLSVDYSTKSFHLNILNQVLESRQASESLIISYSRSFNGFAAKLTHQEQQKLADMEGIVSVFPSRTLELETTRSWDFLGLPQNISRNLPLESDIIVGILDTGVWPESESFNDEGLGLPPSKWKGVCQNLTCNNKIIGARFYRAGYNQSELSPLDSQGHGTHVASIVVGRTVKNASLSGLAAGEARGGVPSARLAVYKACWPGNGCQIHDILAGFDDAIADGVDIISTSITGSFTDYFTDPLAIGSFHAMKNGILTSAAVGNVGPMGLGYVRNAAPWMLSVGASSTDRLMSNNVVLGNGSIVKGFTVNTFPTDKEFYPLVADALYWPFPILSCFFEDPVVVKNKIAFCECLDFTNSLEMAHGVVMMRDRDLDHPPRFSRPAIITSEARGRVVFEYMNNTKNPVAKIQKSEGIFDSQAPVVGSFSSRGPSEITPEILKPDISAPGIHILASWNSKGGFELLTGTSIACPHASAAAAFVKSFHPKWSPAAIKSAIITTASPMNASLHPKAEFEYGAGLLNPVGAINPGLVYDADAGDHLQLLCNLGYNATTIGLITGDNSSSCPEQTNGTARDLNYPTMTFFANVSKPFRVEFSRTVTNVGSDNSNYTATINADSKVNVTVNPDVLSFKSLEEKMKFVVTVSGPGLSNDTIVSSSITWSDGKHNVRSPILVFTRYYNPLPPPGIC